LVDEDPLQSPVNGEAGRVEDLLDGDDYSHRRILLSES